MSVEQYRETVKPKRSKFGNRRVTRDGITFDSEKEANRYSDLRLLENNGVIAGLTVHPQYELETGFRDVTGKKHRAEYYEADFQYSENGKLIVEDIKGGKATRTRLFESKKKRFIRRYPNHQLNIIEE